MQERDKETIKPIATILGNIAAIAAGIAIFDNKPVIIIYAIIFALMAYLPIRSLK